MVETSFCKWGFPSSRSTRFILFLTDAVPVKWRPILVSVREEPFITALVASISEDALKSVPKTLREASFGLGATSFETVKNVTVPAAISGIMSSFVLAISRAIGETMIVAMAAGAKPVLNFNPLGQIQTMTGYMVSKSFGEVVVGSLEYQTVFVVGLILFIITLTLNIGAKKIVEKYREVY